jgi:hypothetical protein
VSISAIISDRLPPFDSKFFLSTYVWQKKVLTNFEDKHNMLKPEQIPTHSFLLELTNGRNGRSWSFLIPYGIKF